MGHTVILRFDIMEKVLTLTISEPCGLIDRVSSGCLRRIQSLSTRNGDRWITSTACCKGGSVCIQTDTRKCESGWNLDTVISIRCHWSHGQVGR